MDPLPAYYVTNEGVEYLNLLRTLQTLLGTAVWFFWYSSGTRFLTSCVWFFWFISSISFLTSWPFPKVTLQILTRNRGHDVDKLFWELCQKNDTHDVRKRVPELYQKNHTLRRHPLLPSSPALALTVWLDVGLRAHRLQP